MRVWTSSLFSLEKRIAWISLLPFACLSLLFNHWDLPLFLHSVHPSFTHSVHPSFLHSVRHLFLHSVYPSFTHSVHPCREAGWYVGSGMVHDPGVPRRAPPLHTGLDAAVVVLPAAPRETHPPASRSTTHSWPDVYPFSSWEKSPLNTRSNASSTTNSLQSASPRTRSCVTKSP